jgi:hypothetical protein
VDIADVPATPMAMCVCVSLTPFPDPLSHAAKTPDPRPQTPRHMYP